ncbi:MULTISPECIES: DISARM system SNF2-like helicase DrmD [unclassified Actinopolyspora]|uniref:DISARM system SNF2-like helicase DrmD n=1 Tax=unclassified Actinopolyspora TaxID=2639451 RepID=UPI0013F59803|nr:MULTISPECIES: DISARM system SNF2-like helicase DrmD [unclassified Actinopolyspora]NHD16010.1 helicase [Actinopolyspora sp. BKK2]NHE74776.1 helicase [Actinopolyspora sp. BKK1]
MTTTSSEGLETGALVSVRGQKWVVSEIDQADSSTLVGLQSVEDGRYGETLEVLWELEPGRQVLPAGSLPELPAGDFDPPERLAAFLDAVRWSAVTSADVKTLQAPFRSGVAIEDYQLEPVARAMDSPRVNLLLADDVGLGKTVEAGLVAQELLLRQRSKRIMIVCPAGLTAKWRDEMAEKFGLDFTIIDSECCAQVRREYGSAANPFNIFPRAIVSLPWLRGAKAQRLLGEVLPAGGPTYPRTFDLLILDEAHHVAPAAPKQVYAVDSQQTKLIRTLAPHFTHRLFLSATPHNGYQASFTALLEILDDQRFARGVEPDGKAVDETVVRRLKSEITDADGTPRFAERHATAIPVQYPDSEREIHGLLRRFSELRRGKLDSRSGRKATDLVTLLLKKRLFSSPAAFAHTVRVYLDTLRSRSGSSSAGDEVPEWMEDFFDELATYDDERLAEAEDDALDRTRPLQPDAEQDEVGLLERMEEWALSHEAQPDAKARELINYLEAVCKPDRDWTNERVVVFTEYRDTQQWLANLLRQEGLGGTALAELHGGMSTDDRERLRVAFQKHPTEHPVRILLATDAASEGIDLQRHCHRLVNYDIPFNPNKLEQRIGRIDRYGQNNTPEIRHFVGTGWDREVDSYEADLEFLSRVAGKVARMEEDLGSVNAVLSDKVQRRMLGESVRDDEVDNAGAGSGAKRDALVSESNVGEQVRKLRSNLDQTVDKLGTTPRRVKRVVDTALELARQQPLREHVDDKHAAEGMYDVPALTGSWSRATEGLTEKPADTERGSRQQQPRQLPVTFDPAVAEGRDDVVLAHLNHPLVSMSTGLLRSAVSNEDTGLKRVTAVVSDDDRLEDVLVGAYSRFVLVGADGVRLHEEVLYAGGWAPANGRFRRLENLTTLGGILDRALSEGTPVPPPVWNRIADRWPKVRDGLLSAIDWRTRTRQESLRRTLAQREQAERERINTVIDQFAATLRAKLAEDEDAAEEALFSRADVTRSREERAQYRRDRQKWQDRLDQLATERDRELGVIAERYREQEPHRFPVAVVVVVPKREVTR